jgi:hypothetical protein
MKWLIYPICVLFVLDGFLECRHQRTHTFVLEYSIEGKRQPALRFQATNWWTYSDSVEWVNDNDEHATAATTVLGGTGTIDKDYVLKELK